MREISWAAKKSWKLRGRNARNIADVWMTGRFPSPLGDGRFNFFLAIVCDSVTQTLYDASRPDKVRSSSEDMTAGDEAPAVSRLRRRGGCGRRGRRRENARTGSQQSPVRPSGIAKEDFALPRLGIEPAREQREMFR